MRAPSGLTRVAAAIGDPIRHSLSPVIHNAAFDELGLDWVYVAFEVAAGSASAALDGARALGIEGLSVTMPHKQDVARAVDDRSDVVVALDACNCVVRMADGRLRGENTDGGGFVDSLSDVGVDVAGLAVCVLGAGGAARAVIHALAHAGAGRIAVVNRSPDAAVVAAALAGDVGFVGAHNDVAAADLIVNATSVGMGSDLAVPFDFAMLKARHIVADLVYQPLETPLLRASAACGATTVDGLGMLVHQAARAFGLWTGELAPVEVMRAAAIRHLSG